MLSSMVCGRVQGEGICPADGCVRVSSQKPYAVSTVKTRIPWMNGLAPVGKRAGIRGLKSPDPGQNPFACPVAGIKRGMEHGKVRRLKWVAIARTGENRGDGLQGVAAPHDIFSRLVFQ